jgi:trigger factor
MQVTETVNSGLKREFKVVVNAAELNKEMDAKLKDMAGKAQIKGFRPGKVPAAHLKSMYGKSVMAEVVQTTVDTQSRQVFADRNLKPAYQPEVKLPEDEAEVNAVIDGKGDLSFTLSAEVIPEFEVKDFSQIELHKHVIGHSDAHIDEALARLADQYKAFEAKPAGAKAETGDKVNINFVGSIDGVEFNGGKGDDIPLEIGSNQFIPGFEDQLVGAVVGDDRTINVTFPEAYGAKELAGKAAVFAVHVNGIETAAKSEIDEAFAKRLGFEDLAKLKDMVKSGLDREFTQMTAMKLKRDVLDAMDKQYTFDLPSKLVDAEFNNIWTALNGEMAKAGKTFIDENTTEEEARVEYKAISERRVRLGLVLGTIGEKEGVQVTDQELQAALIGRARQFPGQEKQVFDYYRKNGNALMELRGPIFEQKVVDVIVGKAKVSDKSVTRDELKALVEDEDEAVAAV